MKQAIWMAILVLITGCNNSAPPQAQMEIVRILSYHPWPASHILKTRGDWALLSSNESIQIDSTKLNAILGRPAIPVPNALIIRNRDQWEQLLKPEQSNLEVKASFDPVNGLICLHSTCASVLAICPSILEMRRGKQCRTFNV